MDTNLSHNFRALQPSFYYFFATLIYLLSRAEGVGAARFPFVLISDTHYDPDYGTPLALGPCKNASAPFIGRVGCDAPKSLLASLMVDVAANTAADASLLFGGDWLRHDIPLNASLRAFSEVGAMLGRVSSRGGSVVPAPTAPRAIGALGNNDFVPSYHIDVTSQSQPHIKAYSEALLNTSLLSAAEAEVFANAGYYFRDLPAPRMRVIVLNTVLYSVNLKPAINPLLNPDPLGQFAFLSARLEEARQQKWAVVLLAHTPPTMNAFYCVMGQCKVYLREEFLSRFRAIVKQYADTIVYQFYGHAHAFSLVADEEMGVPGIILPSVSPVFGNTPSYLAVEYDDISRTFVNFRMRYMNLETAQWSTFSVNTVEVFDQLFGPLSTIPQIMSTTKGLWSSVEAWGTYLVVHAGGLAADVWPGADAARIRQRHLCSMLYTLPSAYTECVSKSFEKGSLTQNVSGGVIAVCVISFLVAVGGILYAILHYKQIVSAGVPRLNRSDEDDAASDGVALKV